MELHRTRRRLFGRFCGSSGLLVSWLAVLLSWIPAPRARADAKPAEGSKAAALTEQKLQACWRDLGSRDVDRAGKAVAALAAGGDRAVVWLEQRLAAALKESEPAQIRRLVAEMDADRVVTRDRASEALQRLGPLAEVALRKALAGKVSPEVQARLESLLARCETAFRASESFRRRVRCGWVFEVVDTPRARALRERVLPPPPAATAAVKLTELHGEERGRAFKAQSRADLARAAYRRAHRPGPTRDLGALAVVVAAFREAIAEYPRTEIDAYCRGNLSGLYQYVNAYGHQVRLLKENARAFRGTEQEFDARFSLGLVYLQGFHNPGMGAAQLTDVVQTAKTDHDRFAAQQALDRCKAELAKRAEADRTPWHKATEGVQCRLRPAPADQAGGRYVRICADAQNIGDKVLWMSDGSGQWELEVDGMWYAVRRPKRKWERRYWFGGGRQMYGSRMALAPTWRSRPGGKPLAPAPGKHRLRVALLLQPDPWDAKKLVRVVSNAVQVEIKAK